MSKQRVKKTMNLFFYAGRIACLGPQYIHSGQHLCFILFVPLNRNNVYYVVLFNRFSGDSEPTLRLLARAKQLSCFVLLIGAMSGADQVPAQYRICCDFTQSSLNYFCIVYSVAWHCCGE